MKHAGFILILLLMVTSCTRRPVTPTRESRRTIDTVYQLQVLALQPSIDSLCKIYGDSVYHAAVDSMMKERMEEMEELVK